MQVYEPPHAQQGDITDSASLAESGETIRGGQLNETDPDSVLASAAVGGQVSN